MDFLLVKHLPKKQKTNKNKNKSNGRTTTINNLHWPRLAKEQEIQLGKQCKKAAAKEEDGEGDTKRERDTAAELLILCYQLEVFVCRLAYWFRLQTSSLYRLLKVHTEKKLSNLIEMILNRTRFPLQ